jgi:DNA polymerase-1
VTTLARLDHWIARARELGRVCVDTETTSLDPMQAGLCGVSLAVAPGEACYIPCGHRLATASISEDAERRSFSLPKPMCAGALKPLLEDDGVLKIAQNLKYDLSDLPAARHSHRAFRRHDADLLCAGAALHGHGMDELSELHLSHKCRSPSAKWPARARTKSPSTACRIKEATRYSAEDADVTLRLHALLKPQALAEGKVTVYETLERPLVPVLADMERAGITIDPDRLRRLSNDFANATWRILEKEIHKLAGGSFNIGSPKQLGDILFGKFKLPGGRKTKTGAWSPTPTCWKISRPGPRHRQEGAATGGNCQKLRAPIPTRCRALSTRTGRVHTSYALASTTTGRLSSTDPNLQNIPIRTEEGRKIRKAFIAEPGHLLISADYSQIELRLLAHIGDIPQLKRAFREGLDIHAMTASEIFGVPVEGMPAEIRRRAKAINFGIVYGISAFGLANQLGIPQDEAGAYIKTYFERFPGIRAYMDAPAPWCASRAMSTTLFGRRINIPMIRSKSGGRAAVRRARGDQRADPGRGRRRHPPRHDPHAGRPEGGAGLKARMLLQVHDELVFEAPDKETPIEPPALCQMIGNRFIGHQPPRAQCE